MARLPRISIFTTQAFIFVQPHDALVPYDAFLIVRLTDSLRHLSYLMHCTLFTFHTKNLLKRFRREYGVLSLVPYFLAPLPNLPIGFAGHV